MSDKPDPAPDTIALYPYCRGVPAIRPAEAKRQWMDETPQSYAYRCLPLTIANTHGWEILCGRTFTAEWNGGVTKNDVAIVFDPDEPPPDDHVVKPMSHFGSGTVTFELGMLFQTPPGWNMMVIGPINSPKDGISPLSGVIETDWSPYTFTMNWKLTRPGLKVPFSKGEPIAHIFPVPKDNVTRFEPQIRQFWDNRELALHNAEWSRSRAEFNQGLSEREAKAVAEKWQKAYYSGVYPNGKPTPSEHHIKLRVPEFKDMRTAPPSSVQTDKNTNTQEET